jgi:hypothetical protein
MYKILIAFAFTLVLSACSYFTMNATMCDQIASEPGVTIPQECRNYNEEEADKAFNKLVEEKKVSDKDIQFNQEEEK